MSDRKRDWHSIDNSIPIGNGEIVLSTGTSLASIQGAGMSQRMPDFPKLIPHYPGTAVFLRCWSGDFGYSRVPDFGIELEFSLL